MEPPSLTREPRGPFGVMAVEGILDQFCISRHQQGRLRKFGTGLQPHLYLHFPFRLARLRRICENAPPFGGRRNDEANGCAGVGGLLDDPRFCPESNESLSPTSSGRQGLPAEDL